MRVVVEEWERIRRTRLGLHLSRAARALAQSPALAQRALHALSSTRLPAYSPSRGRLYRRLGGLFRSGREGPDLSREVSVAVATVGQSTLPQVLEALRAQDCRFSGPEVVRNVSPSGAALQAMTDLVTTPYFVQLGEDMVLKPYAVRAMYQALAASPPEVAGLVFPLWDTHLARTIMGVKVLRTEVLRRVPYRSVGGTGYDLESRLRSEGYRLESREPTEPLGRTTDADPDCFEVMGEHLVEGKTLLFERYRTLFAHLVEREDMDSLHRDFGLVFSRLGLASSQEDVWALLGAVAGIAQPVRADRSYHLYPSTPGLREVRYLVNRGPEELVLTSGGAEGLLVLERALALFASLESVCLRAGPEEPDPLEWAELAQIAARSRARGLELSLETRAALERVPPQLEEATIQWVGEASAVEAGALDALAAWPRPGRVTVCLHVSRRDFIDEARLSALQVALERAEALGARVALSHVLPPAEGSSSDWEAAFWSEALCEGDPLLARFQELKARAPSLRLPLALRAAGSESGQAGRTWSRCDSPFRALAIDAEGLVSGCRAGLRPNPGEEELPIFAAQAEELWFERQPRRLRNELLGKRPMHPTCRACHWNHSA